MKQSEVFLAGEGERWLQRNETKLTAEGDPVLEAIDKYKISPQAFLEVGCANGWRLWELKRRFWEPRIEGIDPAIRHDECTHWTSPGIASDLSRYDNGEFDCIIYGWCLYLTDPEDYLKISMEGDRVLADGGYLIVYDFHADHPYKTPYKHKKGLFSHHYDFSRLWLSHPGYSLYGRTIQDTTSVTILKKDLANAFSVKK